MSKNTNLMVKNVMEVLVWNFLDDILEKFPEGCNCEQCRYDIAALALNQLTPKYVATEKGEIYTKIQFLEVQYRADIVGALTRAIAKVIESPRCNMAKK